jgi:hypothetical protein
VINITVWIGYFASFLANNEYFAMERVRINITRCFARALLLGLAGHDCVGSVRATPTAASSGRRKLANSPELLGAIASLWEQSETNRKERILRADRTLQESPACGDILATLTKDDVVTVARNALAGRADSNTLAAIDFLLVPSITYGVQVRKVCSSCADHEEGCGQSSTSYGWNQTHSGLLFLPLEPVSTIESVVLKQGMSLWHILCHGTRASTLEVPSNEWVDVSADASGATPDAEIAVSLIFTATAGTVGVMPDYMGYAESRLRNETGEPEGLFRAYLVRQAYATATLPLVYESRLVVKNFSDCQSAVSDKALLVGYSEGGFAAASLANDMFGLGFDIVSLQAGGAPFRLSSEQVLTSFEQVRNGSFQLSQRYYISLLGSAFSSTYRDLPNFGTSQNMLDPTVREQVVALVHSGAERSELNSLNSPEDPLSILSPALTAAMEQALDNGESDPCKTSAVVGESDLLCRSLQEQDLTSVLEASTYPVTICHSPDDDIIPISNLPDFAANSLLGFSESSGAHSSAAIPCFLNSVVFWANNENFDDSSLIDTTSNSCNSENLRTPAPISPTNPTVSTPVIATTEFPTIAPVSFPTTSASPTIVATEFSQFSLLFVLILIYVQ